MTSAGRAFPLVLAAPSGAGKTTLARALVERTGDLVFALSATTRPPRAGEKNNVDYRFVDDAGFDRLVESDAFLEWARVHEHRYGTLREGVALALDAGTCVVLDIDVQGARRVRDLFDGAVLVFVLPPSAAELERRLANRGSEGDAQKRVRLRTAIAELQAIDEFDYVLVNDDFDAALAALGSIVVAEKHRRTRWSDLDARVAGLDDMLTTMLGGKGT